MQSFTSTIHKYHYCRDEKIGVTLWSDIATQVDEKTCLNVEESIWIIVTSTIVKRYMGKFFIKLYKKENFYNDYASLNAHYFYNIIRKILSFIVKCYEIIYQHQIARES